MSLRRRGVLIAAAVVLVAATTAACSSSSSPKGASTTTSTRGAFGASGPVAPRGSASPILYTTFSGETGAKYQNVAGITASGALVQNILQGGSVTLDELRGLALAADGTLYVANAHKTDSEILSYSAPSNGTRQFKATYAAMGSANPGLAHPYGLTVDPTGNVFASSQDTCLVTRFVTAGQTGTPSAVASWLTTTFPKAQFLPGTWAAQGTNASSDCTVASPQVAHGLQEPRDVALDGSGNLYVADNPAGVVHVYALATGAWVKDLTPSGSGARPVGLYLACSTLYVSSEGTNVVDAIDVATGAATPLPNLTFKAPSGLTLSSGNLYVNDRKGEVLWRYDLATKTASKFVDYSKRGIDDEPEELIATAPAAPCRATSSPSR